MWERAAAVVADAQRALQGVPSDDQAARSLAASDAAGALAAVAGRVDPDGQGPLWRASTSLSRAAQHPVRDRGVRPEALRPMPGVARVAATTRLAAQSGPASTVALLSAPTNVREDSGGPGSE